MAAMINAKVVKLEGIDAPCILLAPHGEVPEELVVDFSNASHAALASRKGPRTYRLQPSSAGEAEPSYRELFEE